MNAKHTPGPWFLQDGYLTVFTTSDPKSGTGLTCALAKVLTKQSGAEQAIANARLIAAAPELLRVIVEVRKWIDANLGEWDARFVSELDTVIASACPDEAA